MKLTELEPRWIKYSTVIEPRNFRVGNVTETRVVPSQYIHEVSSFEEAQGIEFLCPKCFVENQGSIGTHWIDITFEGKGVQPNQGTRDSKGEDVRWNVYGTDYNDLTIQPSIQIVSGCEWHGFVTNGEISGA